MEWPLSEAAGVGFGGQGLSCILSCCSLLVYLDILDFCAPKDSQVGPVKPLVDTVRFLLAKPLLPALSILNADGSVGLKFLPW